MQRLKCVPTPVTDGGRGTGKINLGDRYLTKRYEHADVRFNNGNGALLCNKCSIIIDYGFDHEDTEHYCSKCALDKLAEQAQELGLE